MKNTKKYKQFCFRIYRDSRDSSLEKTSQKHSFPSPLPGPRKQSADSTSAPDKISDNPHKNKRSPSPDRSRRALSGRQQSRERSNDVKLPSKRTDPDDHAKPAINTQTRISDENKRKRSRSANRHSRSGSRSKSK